MDFCLTLISQVVTPDPVSLSLNPDSSQYQLRRQIQAVSRNVLEGNVGWMEKVGKWLWVEEISFIQLGMELELGCRNFVKLGYGEEGSHGREN